MVSVTGSIILQPSIERLRLAILEQNRPGSLDGLLAHHVLKDDPSANIDWQVWPTQDWIKSEFKATNIEHVAALGYALWAKPGLPFAVQLTEGLNRVVERDAFIGEHLSLARSPSRLLGVILGALALGEPGAKALEWCRSVLHEMERRGTTDFDPLVHYLFFRAFGRKFDITSSSDAELYRLAFRDWCSRHQYLKSEPDLSVLNASRTKILVQAATDLRFESAAQAAFVLAVVNVILNQVLGDAVIQAKDVVSVLSNFEPAMRRWRWDDDSLQRPIRWPITQEREVQDLLWLILRSYFRDLVDEDALPKLGHSTYKADFGIPSLRLIVEAKFASAKEDFKKIEKEIQEDCIPYLRDLRYESLIIFVYDGSSSVQEHAITRDALRQLPGVVDVIIVSRPSQLNAKQSGFRGGRRKGAGARD
jgi:hypothetical protein